jgi:hypothetical protein
VANECRAASATLTAASSGPIPKAPGSAGGYLHDLWDTDIRQPEKQRIIEKVRSLPRGQNIRLDLRCAIDVGADSFMELRYFYEKQYSNFLLQDFPFVLRIAILNRFPSWGELLPPPSKNLFR